MSATETVPEQRVVAIVGRPNVGKSALFNRLVGRRAALVHAESGVTRDRLSAEASWEEERFELIDTGGIGLLDQERSPDEIVTGTRTQVDVAIRDAPVLIFVVDVTEGVCPLDTEVAHLLHRSGRRVLVAANKADNEKLDKQAAEFEALGFNVFPVSSLHNRGIAPLMEAVTAGLPPSSAAGEEVTPLRVAVVGRPNVGKSSYINRLLRNERVIVSDVPGTTRDSVEIPFAVGRGESARHYILVDTAGIRKQGRTRSAVDQYSLLRTEKSVAAADVVVLVLDAVAGPTAGDKKIAGQILDKHRGCLLLVNKWDLTGKEVTQRRYARALAEALPFLPFVPIVFASAQSGYNIRRSIEVIDYVGAQVSATLTTGTLNRVLHEAMQRVAPPMVKGRRLKLYYATQVGVRPVRVRLFVNDPKRVSSSYRSYLMHALRDAFGLEGAPVVLQFRRRPQKTNDERATNARR